jgi:hypothetical protein
VPALDVNCLGYFVAAFYVVQELIDEIAVVREVPQMVMGIADQEVRLDDFL